jgi:uncharacterized protein YqeY
MSLKDRLNHDLRAAMRAGDDVRRTTLRGLLAAVRNAEDAAVKARLDLGSLADDTERLVVDFTNDDVIQVVRRQVKQREDSIAQFEKANRRELAEREAAEMAVLRNYLPQSIGREAIAAEARAAIAETGATGPADKGKVMPVLIKRLQGRADGRAINAVVTELLDGRE